MIVELKPGLIAALTYAERLGQRSGQRRFRSGQTPPRKALYRPILCGWGQRRIALYRFETTIGHVISGVQSPIIVFRVPGKSGPSQVQPAPQPSGVGFRVPGASRKVPGNLGFSGIEGFRCLAVGAAVQRTEGGSPPARALLSFDAGGAPATAM